MKFKFNYQAIYTLNSCIKSTLKISLLSIIFATNLHGSFDQISKVYQLGKAASLFHISLIYHYIKYGDAFNFNLIVNSNGDNKVTIERDENNNIIEINDGKKIPLILGSIPRTKANIENLKKTFGLTAEDQIDIYSLNRDYERNWAGLTNLVSEDSSLNLFKYPTTDFTVPSLIDIIRAVRDIENRDQRDHNTQKISYVHCKAGATRSAVIVNAYLLYICFLANIDTNPNEILSYLISRRQQVGMSNKHIIALSGFQNKLKSTGSLNALLELYKDEITKRDAEVYIIENITPKSKTGWFNWFINPIS